MDVPSMEHPSMYIDKWGCMSCECCTNMRIGVEETFYCILLTIFAMHTKNKRKRCRRINALMKWYSLSDPAKVIHIIITSILELGTCLGSHSYSMWSTRHNTIHGTTCEKHGLVHALAKMFKKGGHTSGGYIVWFFKAHGKTDVHSRMAMGHPVERFVTMPSALIHLASAWSNNENSANRKLSAPRGERKI